MHAITKTLKKSNFFQKTTTSLHLFSEKG